MCSATVILRDSSKIRNFPIIFVFLSMSDHSRQVVLSFHDACLRRSDIDLLIGPYWLNDEIIGFAYEYFLREKFSNLIDRIAFISPSVTQLIKFYDHETLSAIFESLDLNRKLLVFFPVNDNSSNELAGGSHWSLLVYRRSNDSFTHFDSISGSGNTEIANSIARNIASIVGSQKSTNPKIKAADCTRQKNGYDCGIFCILFTEKLAEQFLENGDVELLDLGDVSIEEISTYRKKLKTIIDDLCMNSDQKDADGSSKC